MARLRYLKSHAIWPLASVSKQIPYRSFKWRIIKRWFWSRGCKDIRGQNRSLKKISANAADSWCSGSSQADRQIFFWPPTLTSDIFAAPWPKSLFSRDCTTEFATGLIMIVNINFYSIFWQVRLQIDNVSSFQNFIRLFSPLTLALWTFPFKFSNILITRFFSYKINKIEFFTFQHFW